MAEFLIPFIILTLITVIIIQAVERYFYASQVATKETKLLAAIISKNAGEYNAAIRIEKEPKTPDTINTDEVDLSTADPDVFDKFIKDQNK